MVSQLHRVNRLDEYEEFEQDLIIHFCFIHYLQERPVESLHQFNPQTFTTFFSVHFQKYQATLIAYPLVPKWIAQVMLLTIADYNAAL